MARKKTVIKAADKDLAKFVLMKIDSWEHPSWMIDDGKWYRNMAGGGFPKDCMKVKIFKTVLAECFEELDYTKTGICLGVKPDSTDGWLEPNGTYHPCDYRGHELYLELVLKKKVAQVEKERWIRCHSFSAVTKKPFFYILGDDDATTKRARMTPEQRATLERLGFEIGRYD